MYDFTTLSNYLCCVELTYALVIDVPVIFRLTSEKTMKRKKFPLLEITFLHYLVVFKETKIVGTTFGILYSFPPKVTLILQGLDSYTS
jgi:hypothetical protein